MINIFDCSSGRNLLCKNNSKFYNNEKTDKNVYTNNKITLPPQKKKKKQISFRDHPRPCKCTYYPQPWLHEFIDHLLGRKPVLAQSQKTWAVCVLKKRWYFTFVNVQVMIIICWFPLGRINEKGTPEQCHIYGKGIAPGGILLVHIYR